ncbi:MAG: NADP-dependent oxidoreductase [Spirochaetales bacterium]|nr:NADP-dependent oxidoreductase [Spirochaetales bacterium]
MTSKEIRLKSWPNGLPVPDDFETAETVLPGAEDNQLLVRNVFMSVDPYMRGRLRPGKSYTASFQLGEVLSGGAVGQVIESHVNGISEGDYVLNGSGFREYFISDGSDLSVFDSGDVSPSAYLGVLGMPGLTAYTGLLKIGAAKPGETVYVSAAAGAVGSAVCQIAKILGCRVVASAGSEEKVRWLSESAGVDEAFNYKDYRNISRELRRRCPEGIDVYFDNVGGDHLEAALGSMNDFGRVAVCGMISLYNDTAPRPGPANMSLIIGRRLRIQGFIVSDYPQLKNPFERAMKEWIREGKVLWKETVVEGIGNATSALIGLFSGDNIGKMIVKLG